LSFFQRALHRGVAAGGALDQPRRGGHLARQ
jgi:hypothetical protein